MGGSAELGQEAPTVAAVETQGGPAPRATAKGLPMATSTSPSMPAAEEEAARIMPALEEALPSKSLPTHPLLKASSGLTERRRWLEREGERAEACGWMLMSSRAGVACTLVAEQAAATVKEAALDVAAITMVEVGEGAASEPMATATAPKFCCPIARPAAAHQEVIMAGAVLCRSTTVKCAATAAHGTLRSRPVLAAAAT